MKWSWKIGRLWGVELRMHATFLLLLGWAGVAQGLNGVVFIAALFGCVILHELGHSLAARRYGIGTRDITLLPIGGLARLERMPEKPAQELWVAMAGPLVNVGIAAALGLWLAAAPGAGGFVKQMLIANVSLVLFNLIPAFPMDGGRALRALLAWRMEYAKATRIAARVGQALAVAFGVAGLFSNPMLLLIAAFVWIAATQEARAVEMKAAMAGAPAGAAMLTDFRALESGHTLADAARMMVGGSQPDLPVVEEGRAIGVLTRMDLLEALARYGPGWPAAAVMRREFATADAAEPLESAFERLQRCECQAMPVMQDGRLAGLLTMEKLHEFFLIQKAMSRGGGSAAVGTPTPSGALR